MGINQPSLINLANSEQFPTFLPDADEVKHWRDLSDQVKIEKEQPKVLDQLQKDLQAVVFVLDNTLTLADIFLFVALHPVLSAMNDKQKAKYFNIVRYCDFIQNQPFVKNFKELVPKKKIVLTGLSVTLHPSLVQESNQAPPAETQLSKSESQPSKSDTQPETQKKAQKENKNAPQNQPKKQPQQKTPDDSVETSDSSPSALDIRVGKIVEISRHPDATSLYVEKIDLGEAEPRTIVSGLVPFIPIEELQNRTVLVLCNLKPAAMRGVKSFGMVLCASNSEHTAVELITPPEGTPIGERIYIDGEGSKTQAFEPVLNPKKKIWETLQPGLKTNKDLVATWNGKPFLTSLGPCKAKSLVDANIK